MDSGTRELKPYEGAISLNDENPELQLERYACLNLLIQAHLSLTQDAQTAYDKAKTDEQGLYDQHKTSVAKSNYMDQASKHILDLQNNNVSKIAKGKDENSKQEIAIGLKYPEISDDEFYSRLKSYVLSKEQLKENSYPITEPGRAVMIHKNNDLKRLILSSKANVRICFRCNKQFRVDKEGRCLSDIGCLFHTGRIERQYCEYSETMARLWTCCQRPPKAPGCQRNMCHVHQQNLYDDLEGYVRMLKATQEAQADTNCGVFAIGSEMVFTTSGYELARVTVVSSDDSEVVLDNFVRPANSVVDYNNSSAHLAPITTSLQGVQKMLQSIINSESILLGHCLNNDLNALKILHDKVVDTSIVFPHPEGKHMKRSLRSLVKEKLHRSIQQQEGGQDSQEDVDACLSLMRWKVHEEVIKKIKGKMALLKRKIRALEPVSPEKRETTSRSSSEKSETHSCDNRRGKKDKEREESADESKKQCHDSDKHIKEKDIGKPTLNLSMGKSYTDLMSKQSSNTKRTESKLEKLHTGQHIFTFRKDKGGIGVKHSDIPDSEGSQSKNDCQALTSGELYVGLQAHVLTKKQLVKHCYPTNGPSRSKPVVIHKDDEMMRINMSSNAKTRICSRCEKEFDVDDEGKCISRTKCKFHNGRIQSVKKKSGSQVRRWSCCDKHYQSYGCQTNRYHVHQQNIYDDLEGYVRLPKASVVSKDGNYGVYAIDCEMVFTTKGFELARATVVNDNGNVVFDSFVRPGNRIVDCNTNFSGISANDMRHVKTSLKDIQKTLQKLCNSETILIGHSLNKDLIALKIIHDKVVDTSVVFPHREGKHNKRSLRSLVKEKLQRSIQEKESGHDSIEDASACMELMNWKVSKDIAERAKKYGEHETKKK